MQYIPFIVLPIVHLLFKGGSTDAVHSGLARQVSSLLTNHLARATECCGNQAAGNDALQDVLSLLNDLSRLGLVSPFHIMFV